jgi:hypothetical protein
MQPGRNLAAVRWDGINAHNDSAKCLADNVRQISG